MCSLHIRFILRYVFDENGVNLTLQAATAAIRDSFNELSTTGVPILDPKTGERVP